MIHIDVDATDVSRGLDVLASMPDRGLLSRAAEAVLAAQVERYRRKVDPDGNRWVPWSPRTKKKHARHTLMHDTGDLFDSLKVHNVGRDSADVGTDVHYSVYHQRGEGVPVREILGVSPGDLPEVQALLVEYVDKAVG